MWVNAQEYMARDLTTAKQNWVFATICNLYGNNENYVNNTGSLKGEQRRVRDCLNAAVLLLKTKSNIISSGTLPEELLPFDFLSAGQYPLNPKTVEKFKKKYKEELQIIEMRAFESLYINN